jgi:hypothetical protein
LTLQVLSKAVDITERDGIDIDPDLFIDDSDSVLVLIPEHVVGVPESKLDPYGKGINHIAVLDALFRKNIFHHFVHQVCLYKLEDAELKPL